MSFRSTKSLSQKLAQLRSRIDALKLPLAIFVGLSLKKREFRFSEVGGEKYQSFKVRLPKGKSHDYFSIWLSHHNQKFHTKTIAIAIESSDDVTTLASKLWLKNDTFSFIIGPNKNRIKQSTRKLARTAASHFRRDASTKVLSTRKNEVEVVPLVTLKDYQAITSPRDLKLLQLLTQKFQGKTILFFNSTPQGGGVAIMRHALIRLYRLLGVDAHWCVMTQNQEVFSITKTKFHNVLQKVAAEAARLTPDEELLFNAWSAENASLFREKIKIASVIVIDDPQPSGLIPHIKTINPAAKIIYRSHIHLEAKATKFEGSPQHATWEFIWQNIKYLDVFVSHPLESFLPNHVPPEKVVFMPATTDPLDGLNKPLSSEHKQYYHQLFAKILLENNQTPLDMNRPYLIQVARFDPSKGIPHLIEVFHLLRQKLGDKNQPLPQLVIVGNGSIDDPDGLPIYNLALSLIRKPAYRDIAKDVKIAMLPHIDPLLNTLLADASIAFQLSSKEGFEVKVTEALMKGVPVVASSSGGIPLQVKHGRTGFLTPSGETDSVVNYALKLLTKKKFYQKISQNARLHWNKDVTTTRNALSWLFLATELLAKGSVKHQSRNVLNHDIRMLIAAAHPHLFSKESLQRRAETSLRAAKRQAPSHPEKLLKLH